MKKITLTKEQVEKCIVDGLSNTKAAKQLGVDYKVYRRWLETYGFHSPVYAVGRDLTKEELEECIRLGYGENRASQSLKVGPATYRRWMKYFELKSPHPNFSPTVWQSGMPLCTQCGNHNCIDSLCGTCRKLARLNGIKEGLVAMAGGACVRCGYNDCIESLDFHHLNPAEKEFGLAAYQKDFIKLTEELKKCILLCSNCHRKEHRKKKNAEMRKLIAEQRKQVLSLIHGTVKAVV